MSEALRSTIHDILAGDRDAIGWLYDTFAPELARRLGARFAGFGLDGHDLLHDTFVYVLAEEGRVLRRFLDQTSVDRCDEEALRRFLWNAACGIASNRRRSVLRHPAVAVDEHRDAVTEGGPERWSLARDALSKLAACLFRRSASYALYFQLRYVDGLTPAEVVASTGWSKKKTYKLKQTLDDALDRCVELLGLTPR